MQQVLIIAGIFLTSNLIAYISYCTKSNTNKIEIMNVRSRIKKIDKLNKADKESLF